MQTVYFNGTPCHTYGDFPVAGQKASCLKLTGVDLQPVQCSDFKGRRVVLNIFPSLDTPVCAASVRRFNVEAAKLDNTTVVCVSMDLPFAMERFCSANDIENVVVASAFRSPDFAKNYGVEMVDGPLAGLLARSVVVIDTEGTVIYSQLVDEITKEPDYEAAINVLKGKY